MRRANFGVIVVVGLLLSPLEAPSQPRHKVDKVTLVKMEDDPDHQMVRVSCRIKGDPRWFVCVIDSGATTANGIIGAHQREVSLTIAESLEVRSRAFVHSMLPQGVDIVVGEDVLRQFRSVVFDYESRRVQFRW